MLTISLLESGESAEGADVEESCAIEAHGVVARRDDESTLPLELSTNMICLRLGMASEVRAVDERSGTIDCNRDTLDLGGLYGRLVSVPMMRCVAARWLNAETIWGALKAGFNGTRTAPSLNRAYVTVANSRLFPSWTHTLSPFLTPKLCRPLARTLLSRSSSS